ncbi:hypothetical protein BDR03DRAFT_866047, partial [Suillus americanus]
MTSLTAPPPPHQLMSEKPNETNMTLRIWQQNLNTSMTAQASLLNSNSATDWDIMVIQEPYINFLCNTCTNHKWHVLYSSNHYTHPQQCTRMITLVNTSLDSNSWKQVSFPSSDIVITQFSGPYGHCTIFNIYNDGNSQSTL